MLQCLMRFHYYLKKSDPPTFMCRCLFFLFYSILRIKEFIWTHCKTYWHSVKVNSWIFIIYCGVWKMRTSLSFKSGQYTIKKKKIWSIFLYMFLYYGIGNFHKFYGLISYMRSLEKSILYDWVIRFWGKGSQSTVQIGSDDRDLIMLPWK